MIEELTNKEKGKSQITKNNKDEIFDVLNDKTDPFTRAVSLLREKFSEIPEDLTNKKVEIRYRKDDRIYDNLYIFSDHLEINNPKESIRLANINGNWKLRKTTESEMENLYIYSLESRIDKFISHSDKCEITIEDINN